MANAICVRTTLESDVGAEKASGPEAPPERTLGSLRGLLVVPDDFNAPLPDELLRAFEGESEP